MKLLVDLSNHVSIYTGMTVYATRLLKGFAQNGYKDICILCNPRIFDAVQKLFPHYSCIKAIYPIDRFGLIGKVFDCFRWGRQINEIRSDVTFCPSPSLTSLFVRGTVVQTIHDLQELKLNSGLMLWYKWILFFLILIKCRKIIAISDFVKNEIKRVYPFVSRAKISTIYNSVDIKPDKSIQSPLTRKYILYVGALRAYKNIYTLIKAFNRIKNLIPHDLVIIGRPYDNYWQDEIVSYIEKEGLESRILHVAELLDEHKLKSYYQHAELLIHPSLLEGFGYTPIEAAILETPVLTTRETAIWETTQGLLYYYAPATDEIALAESIMRILNDRPSDMKLKNISKTLMQHYDCAQQAAKVYAYLTN